MAKLGGYLLVDFEGKDISSQKTITGIYDKIENTNKRIVGCNIRIDTTEFKELVLDVRYDENKDIYVLQNNVLYIQVDVDDRVDGVIGVYYDSLDVGDITIYADEDQGYTLLDGQGSTLITNCLLREINCSELPTSDPHQQDVLWNDNGTLKVSQG